jgi:preprotein translocase subunit Sec63
MPLDSLQFNHVKRAYELLGVEHSATAYTIKKAYRAMAKRWHPDLYRAGTTAYGEATRMMESINTAYNTIQRAPLRYRAVENADTGKQSHEPPTRSTETHVVSESHWFVAADRLEFWVRFVCGSILGLFVGAGFALRLYLLWSPTKPVLCLAIITPVLGCALAAARGGDKFWYKFFGV